MASSIAKVGILSIGDMGMGIAKLLVANGFSVATNCKGRSPDTIARAQSARIEILKTDEALAASCAVILSVVPPRDAEATARRVVDALSGPIPRDPDSGPLYLVDLNAVAPSTARHIDGIVAKSRSAAAALRYVDGCIIGDPPAAPEGEGEGAEGRRRVDEGKGKLVGRQGWKVPTMPTSGPHSVLDDVLPSVPAPEGWYRNDDDGTAAAAAAAAAATPSPSWGAALATTLNMRHISAEVGAASGLKMSFAAFTKGLAAISVQSFTTASKLGVLDELRREMAWRLPHHAAVAEKAAVGMAPKAYRWVGEMEEIARTFAEDGGFVGGGGGDGGSGGKKMSMDMFSGAAGTYRTVAEDTVLGKEKIGKRKRGMDVEDMASAMLEGMEGKKKKND